MPVTAIVGAQWGDEGKGRIIDYLAQNADVVIRFQGGDNAGHTVINEYGKHALHLIPSGIFNPNTQNIIGSGCVVNPQSLLGEMEGLERAGVNLSNLWISTRAQMLMPYHRTLDVLEETARGKDPIGTTKRGIGPAYADKSARSGLRIGDLLHPSWLESRLDNALLSVNRKIQVLGGEPIEGNELYALCMSYREKLGARIVDTMPMTRLALQQNKRVLLEGQLGVMRDLDWGIYPYVTSSNPTSAYAGAGRGRARALHRPGDRRGEGLQHRGGRRPLPRGTPRCRGPEAAGDRRRVWRHHRAAAALRLVRRRGHRLCGLAQRDDRPGHHQARRAGHLRGHQDLRGLSPARWRR